MCEIFIIILLSFKKINHAFQATFKSFIDEIFWIYENLFNKIDSFKSIFILFKYIDLNWIKNIHEAINKIINKLRKYYN